MAIWCGGRGEREGGSGSEVSLGAEGRIPYGLSPSWASLWPKPAHRSGDQLGAGLHVSSQ